MKGRRMSLLRLRLGMIGTLAFIITISTLLFTAISRLDGCAEPVCSYLVSQDVEEIVRRR